MTLMGIFSAAGRGDTNASRPATTISNPWNPRCMAGLLPKAWLRRKFGVQRHDATLQTGLARMPRPPLIARDELPASVRPRFGLSAAARSAGAGAAKSRDLPGPCRQVQRGPDRPHLRNHAGRGQEIRGRHPSPPPTQRSTRSAKQDLGRRGLRHHRSARSTTPTYPGLRSSATAWPSSSRPAPTPTLRAAAEAGRAEPCTGWSVAIDYREDVYKAVHAYAKTEPKLAGEEARLLRRHDPRLPPRRAWPSPTPNGARRSRIHGARNSPAQSTDCSAPTSPTPGRARHLHPRAARRRAGGLSRLAQGQDRRRPVHGGRERNLPIPPGRAERQDEQTRKRVDDAHNNMAADKNVPLFQSSARTAQPHRARARLQILGRLPDRGQDGQNRRGGGAVHGRPDRGHAAEVRRGSGRDATPQGRRHRRPARLLQ